MDHRFKRLLQRGSEFFQAGDLSAAQACFDSLLARDPNSGAAWFRLSLVSARRGQFARAVDQAERAIKLDGERPASLAHLARCQIGAGRVGPARKTAEAALALCRRDGEVNETLAIVFARLGERHRSLALFDQLIGQHSGPVSARYNRALVLCSLDRLTEAANDLKACLASDPLHVRAHLALATIRKPGDRDHVAQLQELLRVLPANHVAEEALALALHHELDKQDRIDDAWAALSRALAVRARRSYPDPEHRRALFATLEADANVIAAAPATTNPAPPLPILVVGLPRAGSELLAQLLCRNDKVRRPPAQNGLLPELARMGGHDPEDAISQELLARIRDMDPSRRREHWLAALADSAEGGSHVLFCRPLDFQLVGLVLESLPEARVLHLQRDPRDVCFSHLANLSPFPASTVAAPANASPDQVADYYRDYDRLMRVWQERWPSQIMDIPYETLVTKPEMLLRVVCAFTGLRFDGRSMSTKDLTTDRIGHWQRYERFLPIKSLF